MRFLNGGSLGFKKCWRIWNYSEILILILINILVIMHNESLLLIDITVCWISVEVRFGVVQSNSIQILKVNSQFISTETNYTNEWYNGVGEFSGRWKPNQYSKFFFLYSSKQIIKVYYGFVKSLFYIREWEILWNLLVIIFLSRLAFVIYYNAPNSTCIVLLSAYTHTRVLVSSIVFNI